MTNNEMIKKVIDYLEIRAKVKNEKAIAMIKILKDEKNSEGQKMSIIKKNIQDNILNDILYGGEDESSGQKETSETK